MADARPRRRVELEHLRQECLSGQMHVTRLGLPGRFWIYPRYMLAMRKAELDFVTELIDDIEQGRLSLDQPAPDPERFGADWRRVSCGSQRERWRLGPRKWPRRKVLK